MSALHNALSIKRKVFCKILKVICWSRREAEDEGRRIKKRKESEV